MWQLEQVRKGLDTNSIRQRSNCRWFLRRTVKQSYRVTTLVLVVWQAKEVTQWLFTDRVYQGGLSLGFWETKSRHLCQNYAISTWETGVRNRCWSAAKEQPLGLFSLLACILSNGCFFAAAFSLRWGCREKSDGQEGKGFQQTQLQVTQNIPMITGLLSSTVSCSHGYPATVPSLDQAAEILAFSGSRPCQRCDTAVSHLGLH